MKINSIISTWNVFLIIVLSLFTITFFNDNLLTEELFRKTYQGSISNEMLAKIIHLHYSWSWISYIISPLIISIKIFFIASIFYIGSVFIGKEILFKNYLRVVVFAEVVQLIYIYA